MLSLNLFYIDKVLVSSIFEVFSIADDTVLLIADYVNGLSFVIIDYLGSDSDVFIFFNFYQGFAFLYPDNLGEGGLIDLMP